MTKLYRISVEPRPEPFELFIEADDEEVAARVASAMVKNKNDVVEIEEVTRERLAELQGENRE